jgi:hypothetical protein
MKSSEEDVPKKEPKVEGPVELKDVVSALQAMGNTIVAALQAFSEGSKRLPRKMRDHSWWNDSRLQQYDYIQKIEPGSFLDTSFDNSGCLCEQREAFVVRSSI